MLMTANILNCISQMKPQLPILYDVYWLYAILGVMDRVAISYPRDATSGLGGFFCGRQLLEYREAVVWIHVFSLEDLGKTIIDYPYDSSALERKI